MYRTASPPLFGIPDYPTLRRVKPLPKRRRTSLNVNSDINVNLYSGPPVKTPSSLSHTSSKPYASPVYHPPPHPPGQNSNQSQSQHIPRSSGVPQSTIGVQDSEIDWGPLLQLPEEILRVAYVLPGRNSPGIDGGGGGDGGGDASNGKPLLLPEHESPQMISSDSLPIAVTPPPSSDASTDDDSDSQTHTQASNHATSIQRHPPLTPEDSNGEEELESEGTEGDLQERLFLRAETDRLLAHADSLSAKMTLQSYYHSIGLGISEFDSRTSASPVPIPGSRLDHVVAEYAPPLPNSAVSLGGGGSSGGMDNETSGPNPATGDGYVAVGVGRGQREENGDGRGDYVDHMGQQGQGNTKKRKVPANVGGSPPHHHLHHYSSYRGALGVYGAGTMGYGDNGRFEEEEREFNFGCGFGMDFGAGTGSAAAPGSNRTGDIESDVFGPLPGSTGGYQHISPDDVVPLPPRHFHRKAKLSPATLAGLQRKELVRSRKKQLEAIMGPLSVGNTWTLDHALSANFPSLLSFSSASSSPSDSPSTDSDPGLSFPTNTHVGATSGRGSESNGDWDVGWSRDEKREFKVRLSRREKMRIARAARLGLGRLGRHPDAAPFPTGEFTLSCPSATAERLVAIQEEVANLRNLFGAELARQTAKAAKSNKGAIPGKTGKKRPQQRARTIMNAKSGEQPAEFLEMPQKGADALNRQQAQPQQTAPSQSLSQAPTPKKGKKKKRSTLANASNPHHLRNYVPSRLPHAAGGGGSTGGNHGPGNQAANASLLWPLALKFLSAELPPRKRKGANGGGQNGVNVQSLPQLVVPQEEWICSFCEYSLFYGDEAEYRRSVRNRKKILKRRRRARERAAAAASGVNAAMKSATGAAPVTEKTRVEDEEYEDDPGYDSIPSNATNVRVDGTGRARAREPPG